MARNELETAIDQLYQLPLEEFTPARNSLAKRTAGDDGARIKTLRKPGIGAWAVNQLYWQSRATYDALVKAAEEFRAVHRALLTGKSVDVRKSGEKHRPALRAATDRAVAILDKAGHRPTDATRQAIAQTLEALPVDAPPGRLTDTLQPAGFSLLAGVVPAAVPAKPREPIAVSRPTLASKRNPEAVEAARLEAQERVCEQLAQAQSALREAAREATRAASAHEGAQKTLQTMKAAVADAEAAYDAARTRMLDQEKETRRLERDAQTARFNVRDAERRVQDAQAKAR